MKRILAALLLIPALAVGAGNDLLINQRNPADTATLTRAVPPPSGGGVNGVMGYNGATNLPVFFRFGAGLALDSGAVVALPQAWTDITGKPNFAAVATSGAYADLTGVPSTFNPAAHTQAWSTITSTPTTLTGYGISDGVTQAALTSGLAGKFNTPTGTAAQYLRGDGSVAAFPTIPGGTVTSITAGTGLAGGTITTTGTISLSNTGTAGSYANVTTDAQGRVTAGTSRSQSTVTRPLNTAFQPNTTRDVDARYSVQCTVTASISGGQNCDVFLEIASDQAFTTAVQQVGVVGQGQVYTLAIALQGVQPQTQQVIGYVPAGYWVRIRTAQNLGSPSFSYRLGQEILQ